MKYKFPHGEMDQVDNVLWHKNILNQHKRQLYERVVAFFIGLIELNIRAYIVLTHLLIDSD